MTRLGLCGLMIAILLNSGPSSWAAPQQLFSMPRIGLSEFIAKIRQDLLRQPLDPQVRIRIAQNMTQASFSGEQLVVSTPGITLGRAGEALDSVDVTCRDGKILMVLRQGSAKIPLSTQSPLTFESSKSQGKLSMSASGLFREKLTLHPTQSGCDLINTLDLEKYLIGLVNAEFSTQWNEEAVGAQVIAARTYALFRVQEASLDSDRYFDLESTVKDQVYPGAGKEDDVAQRSVERTRSWILSASQTGVVSPVQAFYHSTCAGMTQTPQKVWGPSRSSAGNKVPVRCSFCANSPQIRWEVELTLNEVEAALKQAEALKQVSSNSQNQSGKFVGIRVLERDINGRVSRVAGQWMVNGRVRETPVLATAFRDGIGSQRLKSTIFEWQLIRRPSAPGGMSYLVSGRGYGHGVGMCQWGAKTMGEKGFSMASILKHYYPSAILTRIR